MSYFRLYVIKVLPQPYDPYRHFHTSSVKYGKSEDTILLIFWGKKKVYFLKRTQIILRQ